MRIQRHSLDPRVILAFDEEGIVSTSLGESRVAQQHACPACGEDRTDMLVWQDDDTVTCEACGLHYDPFV